MKKLLLTAILVICVSTLYGCSSNSSSHNSTTTDTSLPVRNLTGSEKVTPSTNFNPHQIENNLLSQTKVSESNGKQITLANIHKPILFEAYWCPHCQRTLLLINSNRELTSHKPVIVSTGFPPNTSLQEAVNTSKKEFSLLGLKGFTVYYDLAGLPSNSVPGIPTMLFKINGSSYIISGEHKSYIWEMVLN